MNCCMVCCSNKNNLKQCPFCLYQFCKNCIETYTLSKNNMDIHCISCNIKYTHQTSKTILTKKFLKITFNNHKKQLLFNEQISLLPETMFYAYIIKDITKKENEDRDIIQQLLNISKQMPKKNITIIRKIISNQSIDLTKQDKYVKLYFELFLKHKDIIIQLEDLRERLKNNNPKNITKCPICPDGYLNQHYICMSCDSVVCKKCLISIDGIINHECDKNILENIKTIKNTSKKCPKCSIFVSKIDGCNQMFCSNCKTCFDWETSNIIHKNVHNVDFFRTLTNNNQAIPSEFIDENCICSPSKFLEIYEIIINNNPNINIEYIKKAINIYQKITYNKIKIEHMETTSSNYYSMLKDARIAYILKEINKDKFIRNIYEIYIIHKAMQSYYDIFISYRLIFNNLLGLIFMLIKKEDNYLNKLNTHKGSNIIKGFFNYHIEQYNKCLQTTKEEFTILSIHNYKIDLI